MSNAVRKSEAPPREAFQFLAPAELAPAPESGNRRFSGVAYNGGVITDHPYWPAVVFDLSDTKPQAPKLPFLLDHASGKRAGFGAVTVGGSKIVAEGELLPTEFGTTVASEADAGFPWQMSVGIFPSRIDEIPPGASAEVNGRTVTGPAHIFRGSRIREVSFVALGADAETSASVFAGQVNSEAIMTDNTQALEARITELESSLAAVTAERDNAVTALAEFSAAKRTEAVKALFAALGRKFEDEAAKPYLAMDEATFAAVSKDMQSAKPAASPHLFAEQAIEGEGAKLTDPQAIAQKAREFQAAALARGEHIPIHAAVKAVTVTTEG